MLGWIAATTGGLIKDVSVGVSNAWDVIVDEVSSVPEAFGQGLEHGLFTGPDIEEEEHDHYVDTEEHENHPIVNETIAEHRFGKGK